MPRSRSEYLLTSLSVTSPIPSPTHLWTVRAVDLTDREQLATVILDAYRGTVDDEGEDHEAALTAVDDWLSRLESPHSVVLEQDGRIVAVSFVVNVAGRRVHRSGRGRLGAQARGPRQGCCYYLASLLA